MAWYAVFTASVATAASAGVTPGIISLMVHAIIRIDLTFRDKDSASSVNRGVRSIEAILTNAGMVSSLADLRKITGAFGASFASTAWNGMKGDDIALVKVLAYNKRRCVPDGA